MLCLRYSRLILLSGYKNVRNSANMMLIAFPRHLNMNSHTLLASISLLAFAGCANVVHVTPGTSLEVALARKPEMLRMPLPPPGPLVANNPTPRTRHVYVPPVEPALPTN